LYTNAQALFVILHDMKHIGVAGITIPGSLLCIDAIVEESYKHFGQDSGKHPRITYTNPSLSEIDPPIIGKQWDKVAEDLIASVDILAKAGADFIIIPSNSPHYAVPEVQRKSPVEVLSIVDITVEECQRRGFKKVGILGVSVTMSDGLYEAPLRAVGIEPLTPAPADQQGINDLLHSEVIHGKPTSETASRMRTFIQKLKDAGCDAFIAGCTEIPVVIASEEESPLPFVDTTRLLAKRAFAKAIS
jgi:aspartate racemase